jgi:Brp/Blh family beta-carotene 15,15'-monooxygenase
MCRFLGVYVLQAAAMVAAWCIVPALAFVIFLLISIHHFAGDWSEDVPVWSRLSAAATIISVPAFFHPRDTAEIFAVLVPAGAVPHIMVGLKLLAFAAIGLMILGMLLAFRHAWRTAAEMLSLPLLAWALPPLAFFVVYFCGLHSPRHFLETLDQLSVRSDIVWAVTIGITFLTLSVCVAAFFVLPSAAVGGRLLQIVFVGLAALTVPHMLLMEKVRLRAGRVD